jgi:hypothetical protein
MGHTESSGGNTKAILVTNHVIHWYFFFCFYLFC